MKNVKIKMLLVACLLIASGTFVAAQEKGREGFHGHKNGKMHSRHHGHFQKMNNLPDLSDEQKATIKELKLAHMKESLPLKNKLGEKSAQLRTLTTVDNPDMKQVNKLIEEIGDIRTDMMKRRIAHKQEIRSQLTDEQRLLFDSRAHGGHHRGKRF